MSCPYHRMFKKSYQSCTSRIDHGACPSVLDLMVFVCNGGCLILPSAKQQPHPVQALVGNTTKLRGAAMTPPTLAQDPATPDQVGSLHLKSCGVQNCMLLILPPKHPVLAPDNAGPINAQLGHACWLGWICVSFVAAGQWPLHGMPCSCGMPEASGLVKCSTLSRQGFAGIPSDICSFYCRPVWSPA